MVMSDCFAKMDKDANKFANIKGGIFEIKTRLRLSTENNSDAAVVEGVHANDHNETFSPLSINFPMQTRRVKLDVSNVFNTSFVQVRV